MKIQGMQLKHSLTSRTSFWEVKRIQYESMRNFWLRHVDLGFQILPKRICGLKSTDFTIETAKNFIIKQAKEGDIHEVNDTHKNLQEHMDQPTLCNVSLCITYFKSSGRVGATRKALSFV